MTRPKGYPRPKTYSQERHHCATSITYGSGERTSDWGNNPAFWLEQPSAPGAWGYPPSETYEQFPRHGYDSYPPSQPYPRPPSTLSTPSGNPRGSNSTPIGMPILLLHPHLHSPSARLPSSPSAGLPSSPTRGPTPGLGVPAKQSTQRSAEICLKRSLLSGNAHKPPHTSLFKVS